MARGGWLISHFNPPLLTWAVAWGFPVFSWWFQDFRSKIRFNPSPALAEETELHVTWDMKIPPVLALQIISLSQEV